MTKQQRRSRSQLHNRMKSEGYRWHRRRWWREYRFAELIVTVPSDNPVLHWDHELALTDPAV